MVPLDESLSFNQPKFSPTPIWDSNGITIANRSVIGKNPMAIFVNTNNTTYIANRDDSTLVIWDEKSVNPTMIIPGNFTELRSLFVTSNDDIYVDDGGKNGRVQKWIAETNTFVTVMHVNSSCFGLFVNINDTLYCSMRDHHQIVKRSLNDSVVTSYRVAAGTGIAGSASNQFRGPSGIFVDLNLDLYVADYANNRVQLFQSGKSDGITVAGSTSLYSTITLSFPSGIILNADKYLFIVDQGKHRIVGSGLNGFRCLVGCFGQGSQSNQLNFPSSLSFDHSGNIFVTDYTNHRIQKFLLMKDSFALSSNQPKFCPTPIWDSNGITIANQSIVGEDPTAIFVNTNNTIYVANRENNTILIWHEESVNLTKIIAGNFTQLRSLFVTSNGDIYIDDGHENSRVQRWSVETNTFVTVMNVDSSCYGLFIDINDTLYCSMAGHDQVVKRSLHDSEMNSNRVAAGTGIRGFDSNQFAEPAGIFVDVNLDLYVADCLNNRVQLFQLGESNGITVVGGGSVNPTIKLDCPSGIILDAEKYLFIVDRGNHRIIGSGLNGFQCLVGCYGRGSQSNQMSYPSSLSFDRFGNMFVIDSFNHRIQKFEYLEELCTNTSSVVQTVYTSKLTTNSSTYFRSCSSSRSYYEAIQMNVHDSGLYTFLSRGNMDTYGFIYEDYFKPSSPRKNLLFNDDGGCEPYNFKFTIALESSITYILVVTTYSSNVTDAFAIFVFGPDNVELKNISSPSVIEIEYSDDVQSKYSLQLTANSQTYSRDCQKSNYYYQTIRMNVMETGYYALSSDSRMNTFGEIYEDDFDPMNPFENLLKQDYRACSFQDFKFIAYLHTGTTYILVVTTSSPNMTGNFSILASGPNNITLDPYKAQINGIIQQGYCPKIESHRNSSF
ncbi:unnamed protein product [Adineta steineri]|uniref:NHL repeat containing protein-like protein n=1 Tax=Adineta steineri TaxID=433720 RepID=A0A819I5E6_9BILA|nr:unnamed protein product [Adineta steineri]